MTLDEIKNKLEEDPKLKVLCIEHEAGFFIYDNQAIINYDGNGYRIFWDDKNVLVELCEYASMYKGELHFDEAVDYVGNHLHIPFYDNVVTIVRAQIEYCEWKFGKFTEYDY